MVASDIFYIAFSETYLITGMYSEFLIMLGFNRRMYESGSSHPKHAPPWPRARKTQGTAAKDKAQGGVFTLNLQSLRLLEKSFLIIFHIWGLLCLSSLCTQHNLFIYFFYFYHLIEIYGDNFKYLIVFTELQIKMHNHLLILRYFILRQRPKI